MVTKLGYGAMELRYVDQIRMNAYLKGGLKLVSTSLIHHQTMVPVKIGLGNSSLPNETNTI